MKSIILILFVICSVISGNAQEPELEISDSPFLNINFDKDEIKPTYEGKKFIDNLSENIRNNKFPDRYGFLFGVSTCKSEKETNPLIDYERVEYLLSYFEKEYNISRWRFQFVFQTPLDFCDFNLTNSGSFMRFSLTGCE